MRARFSAFISSPRRFGPVIGAALWVVISSVGTSQGDVGTAPATRVPHDGDSVSVRSWLVAGLFPSPNLPEPRPEGPARAGFDTDFLTSLGGERAARPRPGTTVSTPAGERVEFVARRWDAPYVDLTDVFGRPSLVCAYLYAELESGREQEAYLHVGTNDAGKVWLGGELVIAYPGDRAAQPSQNVVRVRLRRGRTPLLLKIDQAGGGWGAFVQVYAPRAHREFVEANFPWRFVLRADKDLPQMGDTVAVRVGNWPAWQDFAVPVAWEVVDREETRRLGGTSDSARIVVAEGPSRLIRVRATATHPKGGQVVGECALLAGGEEAVNQAVSAFETERVRLGDPSALSGARRDAYALALYGVEKIRRADFPEWLGSKGAQVVAGMTALLDALDALKTGKNPYAGKTGVFEAAYLSEADGTAQPFTLWVPASYSAERSYALLVDLHGAGGTHERLGPRWFFPADSSYEETTIGMSVLGRGRISGYGGLGEDDVLRAIGWVKSHYPIDPDRVYICGASMGGYGTWRMAAHYPDIFAGAMADCGWPMFPVMPNLVNLPTYINHGDADWVVPVGYSRLGVCRMQKLGCPVVYSEYPGVNHGVRLPVSREGYMTRLAAHRRIADPAHIRIAAAHPQYARMYWGCIEQWDDPHRLAELDAQVLPGNVVSVNLTNVAKARLTPPVKHLTGDGEIVWMVCGRRLTTPRSPDGSYDILVSDGTPTVRAHVEESPPAMRPYAQGAVMELYRGEPLLIVYGTKSRDDSLARAIQRMADAVSRWLRPGNPMEFGTVPMAADTQVSQAQLASHNLFLIGGPNENALTARLMPRLPIREEAQALSVFGSETIPLRGRGYEFLYPNPEHPRRLVYVYASSSPEFYRNPLSQPPGVNVFAFLNEPDPFTPDLVVEEIDTSYFNRFVRMVRFTHGWRPEAASNEVVTRRPKSEREFMEMNGEAYRGASGAPYAMVQRARADRPCPYDTSTVTRWQEVRMLLTDRVLVAFDVTGRELLDLAKPSDDARWMFSPVPDSATVSPDATYRVVSAPEMLWGLAQARQYNPRGLRLVSDERTISDVARRVWGVRRR